MEPKAFCRAASMVGSTTINVGRSKPPIIQSIRIVCGDSLSELHHSVMYGFNVRFMERFMKSQSEILFPQEWADPVRRAIKNGA